MGNYSRRCCLLSLQKEFPGPEGFQAFRGPPRWKHIKGASRSCHQVECSSSVIIVLAPLLMIWTVLIT